MANYTFGNTPTEEAKQLQWHKIKDGNKTLLICDRVILVSVSWDHLNTAGFIFGKEITIDGRKFLCRSLTGGSTYRGSDMYAGGSPTNNEWDRFITREEVITGLPAPLSSDLDSNLNSTDHTSAHNQFSIHYAKRRMGRSRRTGRPGATTRPADGATSGRRA